MGYEPEKKKWCALDSDKEHPMSKGLFMEKENTGNAEVQVADTIQTSKEVIHIRNSCDVEVFSTDTQVAVSLQAALQVAIAIVVNITIADSAQAEKVTQELLQSSQIKQSNKQSVIIEDSKNIQVRTTDTDVAASIQVLLQVLIAVVAQLDIL